MSDYDWFFKLGQAGQLPVSHSFRDQGMPPVALTNPMDLMTEAVAGMRMTVQECGHLLYPSPAPSPEGIYVGGKAAECGIDDPDWMQKCLNLPPDTVARGEAGVNPREVQAYPSPALSSPSPPAYSSVRAGHQRDAASGGGYFSYERARNILCLPNPLQTPCPSPATSTTSSLSCGSLRSGVLATKRRRQSSLSTQYTMSGHPYQIKVAKAPPIPYDSEPALDFGARRPSTASTASSTSTSSSSSSSTSSSRSSVSSASSSAENEDACSAHLHRRPSYTTRVCLWTDCATGLPCGGTVGVGHVRAHLDEVPAPVGKPKSMKKAKVACRWAGCPRARPGVDGREMRRSDAERHVWASHVETSERCQSCGRWKEREDMDGC